MAQRFDRPIVWLGATARVLFACAALATLWVTGSAVREIGEQRKERVCLFELSTNTDKVDSDIAVKQAQIFEAAILRPGAGDTTTTELQRLATELQVLIQDRTTAYKQRADAETRCD
jgi:hypothetical protein